MSEVLRFTTQNVGKLAKNLKKQLSKEPLAEKKSCDVGVSELQEALCRANGIESMNVLKKQPPMWRPSGIMFELPPEIEKHIQSLIPELSEEAIEDMDHLMFERQYFELLHDECERRSDEDGYNDYPLMLPSTTDRRALDADIPPSDDMVVMIARVKKVIVLIGRGWAVQQKHPFWANAHLWRQVDSHDVFDFFMTGPKKYDPRDDDLCGLFYGRQAPDSDKNVEYADYISHLTENGDTIQINSFTFFKSINHKS